MASSTRSRRFFYARIAAFVALLIGVGFSSGLFQRQWSAFFPPACAAAAANPPELDVETFPIRVGSQSNLCEGVRDGHCERKTEAEVVSGSCKEGRMDGAFTVTDAKTGALRWSGEYSEGWPRGHFKVREGDHESAFRIENLHLEGPSTFWERDGDRFLELSGRYERGRRVGRFTRRVEGTGVVRSALVFEDDGLTSKEFFYCTNGNLREVRGARVLMYDAQGKTIDEGSACPLP